MQFVLEFQTQISDASLSVNRIRFFGSGKFQYWAIFADFSKSKAPKVGAAKLGKKHQK